MKKFNGYYGCTFCKHPGKMHERNIRYNYETYEDRTDSNIRADMIIADEIKTSSFGCLGKSVLFDLNGGF